MLERGFQQRLVAAAEVFELALEAALEASQKCLWPGGAMLVAAHDVHDQRGDEGSREQVAGQHGEADGLGQRHEQEARHAGEEEHGHEDDADAERGNEGGHGDLLRAVENGLPHLLAHGKIALDVFDLDGGVVHQDADGQRQPAQGHDVERLADGGQREDGTEDGERNRNRNDDGGAPVAEEEQNHHRRQQRRQSAPRAARPGWRRARTATDRTAR